jgi:hypothetical protein
MAHTINSRNAGSHDPGNVNKAYEPLICRFKLSFFRSRSEIDRSRRSVPRLAIPARTTLRQTSHSHHGRHVRRRPRHHQDPGCHDRQGRQHQLHDGVAAPRQQVRSRPASSAPRLIRVFPIRERPPPGARLGVPRTARPAIPPDCVPCAVLEDRGDARVFSHSHARCASTSES